MPNPSDLPHLIRLLSDDSALVQDAVGEQLLNFGPLLHEALNKLPVSLSDQDRNRIHQLIETRHLERLKASWGAWLKQPSTMNKLENGLALIADFQNGPHYPQSLSKLLDHLAEEYARCGDPSDGLNLAQFLFKTKRFQGAQQDYYNPANSNLVYVLEKGEGIPISLACLYILTAKRLGLVVEGCNFPNHFLARIHVNGQPLLIDCFNGGKCYAPDEILNMLSENRDALKGVIHQAADAESMMRRILSNLIWAYQERGTVDKAEWLKDRLNELNEK